ncbi:MAG TPA: septum formation initiator family protein [Candidatus Faecalicoccus intestinipullorum]|nr:septum formation initiator family protein [Candidatus Faecalicoccus intestinipullorum]
MAKQYKIKKNKALKQKRSLKGSPLKKIFLCGVLLGGTMYLTWSGIQDLQTTAELRLSIQENQQQIEDLKEEKEQLKKTYENLSNPDYASLYARGRYHVTQDGDQVFIFPKTEDEEEKEE